MGDRTAVSVAFCILGAGCADDLYVMHEEFIVHQEESEYLGGACQKIGGGTSAGGVAGENLPSYSFEVSESDEGVRVVLQTSDGDRVAEKSYTDDFLRSGKRDELLLEVDDSKQVRVVLWGSEVCEPLMDLADEE